MEFGYDWRAWSTKTNVRRGLEQFGANADLVVRAAAELRIQLFRLCLFVASPTVCGRNDGPLNWVVLPTAATDVNDSSARVMNDPPLPGTAVRSSVRARRRSGALPRSVRHVFNEDSKRGDWNPNPSGVVHELRDGGRTLYAVVCDDPKRTPFQYAWQLFEEAADWMTSLAQLPRCESPSPCLQPSLPPLKNLPLPYPRRASPLPTLP